MIFRKGVSDLSQADQRAKLPLYYAPQIMHAMCMAINRVVMTDIAGHTITIVPSGTVKRKREDNDNVQEKEFSLCKSLDFCKCLKEVDGSAPSTQFAAEHDNGEDQGDMW